jgi:2-hydroxychromene-2-carboxylate isomerase
MVKAWLILGLKVNVIKKNVYQVHQNGKGEPSSESLRAYMSVSIEYFFTILSPWTYIGHEHFMAIARKHGASVKFCPVSLGQVFPATGGLPLKDRHPARQRYRWVELQRWREERQIPFNLKPKFWPFDATLADSVVIALLAQNMDPEPYVAAALKAVWALEKDLTSLSEIGSILKKLGIEEGSVLNIAQNSAIQDQYKKNIEHAIHLDVFGTPSYVLKGEIFWGQDRLDMLDKALTTGREAFKPL